MSAEIKYADLSATEKQAIAERLFGGPQLPNGRQATWDALTEQEKDGGAAEWRSKHKRAIETNSNRFGITKAQLEILITAISDALPEVVEHYVDKLFDKLLPEKLSEAESRLSKSMDTAADAIRSRTPQSFLVDGTGELVAVYPDGETKSVGTVRGKDGGRGASIMDGAVDESGQLVLRMSDGRKINAGIVRGEPGKPGDPGEDGKNGEHGRDALAAAIVRGIDECRSYPENTYAMHGGAFMVSACRTLPVEPHGTDRFKNAGWLILSDGLAIPPDIEQNPEDPRKFTVRLVLGSGTIIKKEFFIPCLMDGGVWAPTKKFLQGDTATWNGSLWAARRANIASRPGTVPEDWRLMVKKIR